MKHFVQIKSPVVII